MANRNSRIVIPIYSPSFDGRYWGRYPNGDRPNVGAELLAEALGRVSSGAALATQIRLNAAAAARAAASAGLSTSIRMGAAAAGCASGTASFTAPSDWRSNLGLPFADGVEPASHAASFFNFQPGGSRKIHYVDLDAPTNGNGTSLSPYWGYTEVNALMGPGDHCWSVGTATPAKHIPGVRDMIFSIQSASQLGPRGNPNIFRSWPDRPRVKFDGMYQADLGVSVQPGANVFDSGFGCINAEVTRRSGSPGFNFYRGGDGDIGFLLAYGLWSHHNVSTTAAGNSSYGGVAAKATNQACYIEIARCRTGFNTTVDGVTPGGADNTGGVNVLCELGGAGSIVKTYLNDIEGEHYGMRHKHAGDIQHQSYTNWIRGCTYAAYQARALSQVSHHDLVTDCPLYVVLEPQNQVGARLVEAYNITMHNVAQIADQMSSPFPEADIFKLHESIYSNPSRTGVVATFGRYASSNYNTAGTEFTNNLFDVASDATFFTENGVTKTRAQFMAQFGAAANAFGNPLFTNAALNDYTLQSGSPAENFNGQRVGAF